MIETILGYIFGGAAIVVGGSMLVLFGCMIILCLDFFGTMLLNPFVYLFTGKNLKTYEEYKNMPREDDFF